MRSRSFETSCGLGAGSDTSADHRRVMLLSLPGWWPPRRPGVGVVRWARACRASIALGVTLTISGFLLWGAPVLLHIADGWGVPGLCDDAIHRLPLGGLEFALVAIVAGGLIVARLTGALTRSVSRSRDAWVDPFIGHHREVSEFDVVVIPSTRLVAVGVPGSRPQIVISEGLVSALEPRELDAVLRHEMAHHRLHHRNFLLLAAAVDHVFGWLPPVRLSTAALRDAVEEWADLASTRRSPERIARLRSALVRLADIHVTTAGRRALERRIVSLEGPDARDASRPARTAGVVMGFGGAVAAATLLLALSYEIFAAVGHCGT